MTRILILTAALFCGLAQAKSPNVVFFLVDDLGWSDVGCFGSDFYDTPNIDRLASEGVKFTSAYAACHVCSPTRASILTGKYPARLGLSDWIPGRRDFPFQRLRNVPNLLQLPGEEVTLAEALREEGYATGIFGKWHLGRKPSDPTAHGFDIHIPDVPSNWRTFHGPFGMKTFESKKGDYLTDRITDEALTWMEGNQEKEKPFFLYMSHFAVHDPIEGRADLVEKYTGKLAATEKTGSPDFILEGNPDNPDNPTRDELAKLIDTPEFARHGVLPRGTIKIRQKQDNIEFAAMVESVDQSLGRIMSKLEELRIDENTIVIFFSDNGGMAAINVGNPQRVVPDDKVDKAYSTACLPLRGAKGWLYEGGIRVPMIVKWPGQSKAGSVVDEPVISTDFFPTILEMIGQKGETPDGQSFVAALKGESFERGPIFWHFPHYSNHGMQSPAGALRDGDFKLIEYFENRTVQLFNLAEDIGEQRNLAVSNPSKAEELRNKLRAWRKSVSAKTMEPNPNYEEPMQIVSGDPFDPEIHFEAPPSNRVAGEMTGFLEWFNGTAPAKKRIPLPALTRSALAHLRFETIHPFSDGNGRIGRAIAEKALFQADGQPILLALSDAIKSERKQYYEALAATRFTNDITAWVIWFGGAVLKSLEDSNHRIDFLIRKTHFFERFGSRLNPRQEKVLRRMFREGPAGFQGGLSAGNVVTIARTSPATARRDLGALVAMGALRKTGERKGIRYFLNLDRD